MNRSVDGVMYRPTPANTAGRPLASRVATFRPVVSTNQSSDFTTGRGNSQVSAGVNRHTFRTKTLVKRYPVRPVKKSWRERLQLPLIIIGGMLAGFAIQNALVGQVLIVCYGIFAVIYKVPSRTTFLAALAALLIMFSLLILNGNVATSHTFALYTFLLLVVGVITLNREIKQEGGRIYSRRYR